MTTCRPGQLCHSQFSLVLRELLRGFAVSKPKSALAGVKPEWRPPAWDNRAQEPLTVRGQVRTPASLPLALQDGRLEQVHPPASFILGQSANGEVASVGGDKPSGMKRGGRGVELLKGDWRKAGLRSGYIHEQILLRRETLLPDFDVMERVTGDRAALSCLSARLRDLHNLSSRLVAVNKLFPMCI
ncbi:hypothetical protein MHYP_G00256320 [Metynnis hypsauchen]